MQLIGQQISRSVDYKVGELAELAVALDENCLNDLHKRVWEIAKQSEQVPFFCEIYTIEIFKILKVLIDEKYSHLNLTANYFDFNLHGNNPFFINYVTSKDGLVITVEIQNKNDFYALIEKIES